MDKAISAADASRRFSKLLRGVKDGDSYVVTSQRRAVANIVPVHSGYRVMPGARAALLKRLRSQSVVNVGHRGRGELYVDEPSAS